MLRGVALHEHCTAAERGSTASSGFDLHRPISSMKHSGPSFPAKGLTPLTAQKSAHKCFGRVFSSRTDVQIILICRTHPGLPPVEESSPSLPLEMPLVPGQLVHCVQFSGSVQIKALTMEEEAKLQTTSQTQLQPLQKQNAGEREQDTCEHEAARAEYLERQLFFLALSRQSC